MQLNLQLATLQCLVEVSGNELQSQAEVARIDLLQLNLYCFAIVSLNSHYAIIWMKSFNIWYTEHCFTTFRKVIHPDDEISIDFTMMPRRLGDRMIFATFSADEVTDFDGETSVFVVSKGDWEEEQERKKEEMEDEVDAAGDAEEEKEEKEEEAENNEDEKMEEGGGDTNENAEANETEEAPMENGDQNEGQENGGE